MKELLKRKQAAVKFSSLYTPAYATELIIPYLHGKIWECACGEGHMTRVFEKHGLDVYETDIIHGVDFLTSDLPAGIDMVVTNPPYSIKDKFLKHCYELDIPFALLMPLTALGGMKRSKLFREYGLEMLIPDRRINFIYEGAGKACWFHSAWFCHNVLPEKIIFKEMVK